MTFSRKIFSHYHFEKAHTPGKMAQKTQKNLYILIHVFCFVSGKTKMDIENKWNPRPKIWSILDLGLHLSHQCKYSFTKWNKVHKHISSGQQPLFCSPDGSLNEAIYRNSTNLLYSDKQCIAMLLSNRLRNQFVNLYLS